MFSCSEHLQHIVLPSLINFPSIASLFVCASINKPPVQGRIESFEKPQIRAKRKIFFRFGVDNEKSGVAQSGVANMKSGAGISGDD